MPLLHCSNCHHEYESYKKDWEHDLCDWCGCTPYFVKEKTELELLCGDELKLIKILEKINNG